MSTHCWPNVPGRPNPEPVVLPAQVSVSALVELDRDPRGAARRLTRRLPARLDPHAALGTAFHDWVQRFYGAERLFDRRSARRGDPQTADPDQLDALQEAFRASAWALRTLVAVEVLFEMELAGTVVRGRIDAVFGEPDGGSPSWTGRPVNRPAPQRLGATPRSSWGSTGWPGRGSAAARRRRCAAFHYALRAHRHPDACPAPGSGGAAQPRRGALRRIASAWVIIGTEAAAGPARRSASATSPRPVCSTRAGPY